MLRLGDVDAEDVAVKRAVAVTDDSTVEDEDRHADNVTVNVELAQKLLLVVTERERPPVHDCECVAVRDADVVAHEVDVWVIVELGEAVPEFENETKVGPGEVEAKFERTLPVADSDAADTVAIDVADEDTIPPPDIDAELEVVLLTVKKADKVGVTVPVENLEFEELPDRVIVGSADRVPLGDAVAVGEPLSDVV